MELFEPIIQLLNRLRGYSPAAMIVQFAIIWLVVFVVFVFLRGTRGARALKGMFIVLVVAAVAVALLGDDSDWAPLRFLMENFLGFAALAIVIVFQPELRRALMRLGEAGRIFRGTQVEMGGVIDEVVEAVKYLSKNKIGGILAIEREEGLKGIVEAGIKMDSVVSADLLKTIFWPGSALHDMGVVITGTRIVAAGVQFPLIEADALAQELGSRHRAAVGLSHEADCLVVVVSEETGAISLAERGQLLRKLSAEGLKAMLKRALGSVDQAGGAGSGKKREATKSGADKGKAAGGESKAKPSDTDKGDDAAASPA